MFGNLASALTGKTDYRWAQLPPEWGLGDIWIEIIRADHEDWLKAEQKRADNNPYSQAVGDTLTAAAISGSVATATRNRGKRRDARKNSHSDGQFDPEQEERLRVGLSRLRKQYDVRAATEKALEEHRVNMATIGWRNWRGVTMDGGRPAEPTTENKLSFVNLKTPDGQHAFLPETRGGVEVPYGGQPFRDALLDWFLDEAEDSSAFAAAWVEQAAKNSAPSPAGVRVTGTTSSLPSDGN